MPRTSLKNLSETSGFCEGARKEVSESGEDEGERGRARLDPQAGMVKSNALSFGGARSILSDVCEARRVQR
jgi:hypothetical protein